MAKSTKISDQLLPVEEREMTEPQTPSNPAAVSDEEEKFNKEFWKKVAEKVKLLDVSWNRAMDEVRAERLIKQAEKCGSNALLTIIYKWPQMKLYQDNPELVPSLENLISRLTEIILEQDTKTDYEFFRFKEDAAKPTLLHLAAKQNFLHVSQCLVDHYPGLLTLQTREGKESVLPVELALKKRKDDTAAFLISQMNYDRVQRLFLFDDEDDNDEDNDEENNEKKQPVKFYFGDIISYRNPKTDEHGMKKTVLAVLDKFINPRWPLLDSLPRPNDDDRNKNDIERALGSVPYDPMKYDFDYRILETDENGRRPQIEIVTEENSKGEPTETTMITNRKFNHKTVSCLRRIADSENKEAVQHPVVRMLVARKWNKFAKTWFRVKASLYVLFLTLLSFALLYGSTRHDPTVYKDRADKLRGFCEICSLIFLMLHLFDEIGEMARERKDYFMVWHNYVDLLGIGFTFVVLPLRYAEVKYQWTFASLGYIFNFLRLFKFSNVTRTTGLYTTTLVNIIQKDISRFMVVFAVIFIGFCGALFMALKVDDMQDDPFSNFAWLMLAGFRALVEQSPLDEDYQKFDWLVIVILLSYMGVVVVILLNVLIAQLSYTYSEAKKIAKLQYAADTMRIVTRLENSIFASLRFRVKKYWPGDWINDEDLAREILEDSEERHPWETAEERIFGAREIMRKVVRKCKEKDPLETIEEKLTRLTAMMETFPQSSRPKTFPGTD